MKILYFIIATNVFSYEFNLPYKVNWVGEFDNINVFDEINTCKNAFKNIPILIFKNQRLNKREYLDLVKKFDESDPFQNNIIHPFRKDSKIPQIGLCENLKSPSIDFNNVWHMDNVGKYELPNTITSFYFEQVPSKGGQTLFANLINAYNKIDFKDRRLINDLICVYESSFDVYENIYTSNGFRRINNIQSERFIKLPLIHYPFNGCSQKSIIFSPVRFIKFENYDEEISWDIMDYIFTKYINTLDNIVSIKWENNDLVIFNNRLLLHSNTPAKIYIDQNRKFKVIFLNTFQSISKSK